MEEKLRSIALILLLGSIVFAGLVGFFAESRVREVEAQVEILKDKIDSLQSTIALDSVSK